MIITGGEIARRLMIKVNWVGFATSVKYQFNHLNFSGCGCEMNGLVALLVNYGNICTVAQQELGCFNCSSCG